MAFEEKETPEFEENVVFVVNTLGDEEKPLLVLRFPME